MLSLGLGFGSMMEENELEEGEAFSYHADDDCIDPDIALSYIDEKLQNVLGHFQKDFEGGVSAENLGAKFGGYGSFLPAYQRSPTIFSHPRSPPKPPNNTISKSPYNISVERACQNLSVPRDMSVSRIYSTSVAQPSSLGGKENGVSSLSDGGCVPLLDSNNKQVNGSDQKSLKVRIRVGPDSTLARCNAAIYSGLGLDTSPFSSPEDSPDACLRLSPTVRDSLSGSPLSILQVMTCFSVPGGYLLSPLNENLFQLNENGSLFIRKPEMLNRGVLDMHVLPNIKLPVREVKGFSDKKNKSDELNGRSVEDGNLNCKGDTTKMLKKEIDTPASRRIGSSELNMSHQSCSSGAETKADRQIIGDSAKGSSSGTLEGSKEHNKSVCKERFSLPDFAKDDQVISMGNVKSGGLDTSRNGATHSKGNLKSKTTSLEKEIEQRNPNYHKEIASDTLKVGKSKNQKSYDISKLSDVECKSKNDHVAGPAEPMTHVPGQRVVSHERDAEKAIQGNDRVNEGKLRRKGAHIKCALPTESFQSQENTRPPSSVVPKEKKKRSHAKNGRSENTSEMLKSHKETSRGRSRESNRVVAGNKNAQVMESRSRLVEPFEFVEKSAGELGVKKDVNLHPVPMENPPVASSKCAAPTLDAAAASEAPPPLVIKENWVCCDKCQQWRLLPYGADPHHLPKKWKCSMQVWLPGLNKCSISEDETTKAFNAMYLVPAPEAGAKLNGHNDVSASSITPVDAQHFNRRFDHDLQNTSSTSKKLNGITGSSKVPKNSVLKKNLQSSEKNRRIFDARESPLDTKSSIKGCLGLTSKSTDVTTEKHIHKQKEKHEVRGRYSDGGDFIEKSDTHSKSKGKREAHQDGLRTSKKFKKENLDYAVEDKLPNLDMADMTAPGMDSGLSAKATGKLLQNYSDHSSSKDSKCEPRGNLSASIKKSKDPVHIYSNGEFKDLVKGLNVEKSKMHDYAAKKRKMKEWQESQVQEGSVTIPTHELDSRLRTKEGELWKQKKARVSKSEGKECSMNNVGGKMDKTGRSTKILLSGSRDQRRDGVGDEGRGGGKEQIGQYQETAVYRQDLDGGDHLKRDTVYAQLPTAATSSSSKVSGSRKSKANYQEARGSPVESVSSSPLRTSTIEKAAIRRKTVAKNDIVNANLSFLGSQKRCSEGELGSVQTVTRRKETGSSLELRSLECDRAADSGFHGSMVGTYQYLEKEGCHLSGNKDEIHLKKGAQVDLSCAQSAERNDIGDAENMLDRDDKNFFKGTENGNIDGDKNVHNHFYGNGTTQLKSGNSYPAFKEKNKTFNSDASKVKVDASNSISNKMELYSSKNESHFQSVSDFNCNDDTNYQEDLKNNCNFEEEEKQNSSGKQSYFDRRDNLSSNGLEETLDAQSKETNSRVVFVGSSCEPKLLEDLRRAPSYRSENPMCRSLLDGIDRTEMVLKRGISQPSKTPNDKSEAQSSGSRSAHAPIKVSRSDTYPIVAENGHTIKMVKQSRNLDSLNGANPSSLRQAIPNGRDSSPVRKDGPAAAANAVLKEARDIKHKANRLKNEGLDHDSISLYFQSALKFLQGASLLELPSSENARQGETTRQMMQMYSDTARLCEYCAHEYERCKEMAAAALAYKCVEVAYMKVAFYKHAGASKDRLELVTALQTGLPGESPSSSASDIDNLNNQSALDKAISVKAAGSPQIVGNHVISAHNRPNFVRLLSYTNDLNFAFDATKRSQNSIAAAGVSLEKDGVASLSSVRKVLDFNFHNVEGFLRLVRLSLESISR